MGKEIFKALFLAMALASAITTAAKANLVSNGSFENGTFTPDGNQVDSLPVNSTTMTGWTVVNGSLAWINSPNPFGINAQDGSKFLDLTDYRDAAPFGGVLQTVSTCVGCGYQLTFYLGSDPRFVKMACRCS